MSLNKVGKPNQHRLLSELCELNELILSMTQGDFQKIIKEVSEKTEAMNELEKSSNAARSAAEASFVKQSEVNKENDRLLAELIKNRTDLAVEKGENDQKIEKIRSLQSALDANILDQNNRAKSISEDLSKKAKDLAEREVKINARLSEVETLKASYEKKIAALKEIAG